MKKLNQILSITIGSLALTACGAGANNSNASTQKSQIQGQQQNASIGMLKAAYIDLGATGSLGLIPASGYQAANILVFAFADVTTANINNNYLTSMQKIINSEQSGTVNLISLGGQNGSSSAFINTGISNVVQNISQQIKQYNLQLSGGKIDGVDLDLEGPGWSSEQIAQLAAGFKQKGLLVSIAPQVYLSNQSAGTNVDPESPTNLGLTASGLSNVYGKAIASGNVDYLLAQTYNTGGWTVGNVDEGNLDFFTQISHALDSAVKSDCSTTSNDVLCIPSRTKILIGEPANSGAGGLSIYNPSGFYPMPKYDQNNTLEQLKTKIDQAVGNLYPHISGVMVWSLNNDYMPAGYGDNYANAGEFSSKIFGATPAPNLPHFILQVTNTGPNIAGKGAYASVTVNINGAYSVLGNQWNSPIAPNASQSWGTLPSSQDPNTPGVFDSGILDAYFSDGKTNFTATSIIINGYSSQELALGSPTVQAKCPSGDNYKFEANHAYNILVNAAAGVCEIKKIN